MKRRPRIMLILLLLLLGGAIVNVAVAWGCSLWSTAHYDRRSVTTADAAWLSSHGEKAAFFNYGDGTAAYQIQQARGHGFICELFLLQSEDLIAFQKRGGLDIAPAFETSAFKAGWPTLSVSSERWIHTPEWVRAGENRLDLPMMSGGWIISETAGRGDCRFISWRPIWPGFAINTLFYAAILWLLFAAPFGLGGLRRRRRIKRGLCPKCAYPVGTSDVCTECGAQRAVPSH